MIEGDTRSLDSSSYNPSIVVSIFFCIIPIYPQYTADYPYIITGETYGIGDLLGREIPSHN